MNSPHDHKPLLFTLGAAMITLLLFAFQNCGSGNMYNSDSSSSMSTGAVVTTSEFEGTWTQTCRNGTNGVGSSYLGTITVNANYMTFTSVVYQNGNCTGPQVEIHSESSSYQIVGANSSEVGATNLALGNSMITVTPLSSTDATQSSGNQVCGSTSWQAGTSQTFPANQCANFFDLNQTVNRSDMNIVISGNSLFLDTPGYGIQYNNPFVMQ